MDINGNVFGKNVVGKHFKILMVNYIGGHGGDDEIYSNNGNIVIILWNYVVDKL